MLSQRHLERITKLWHTDYGDHIAVSTYIQEICVAYRKQHPHVARIIFSREPPVKTLASITQKIDNQRQTDPNFDYEQLVDIIALTVLCPYESDVQQFIAWMKEAFEVHTDDAQAYRDYESGHRGYHYVISPTIREIAVRGRGFRKRCEIQIKTILQEAFDAKSHDLAYKPGVLEVGEDLKLQFSLLANLLRVIDGQSEFLKRIILKEQQELELRRSACLLRYLRQEDTMSVGRDLMINIEELQQADVMSVSDKLRKNLRAMISVRFCKFAALCAIKLDHDFLKDEAVSYADLLVQSNSESPHSRLVRGAIKWVLVLNCVNTYLY
jgi:ppGpp synthetase/RelA/SpoT-type nucleotidyltranferase